MIILLWSIMTLSFASPSVFPFQLLAVAMKLEKKLPRRKQQRRRHKNSHHSNTFREPNYRLARENRVQRVRKEEAIVAKVGASSTRKSTKMRNGDIRDLDGRASEQSWRVETVEVEN